MATKTRHRPVLDVIKGRKTTFEYTAKAVSQKDLGKILEAGRWAPSILNLQPWRFVVVRNRKLVGQLIEACSYGYFYTLPALLVAMVLPHGKVGGTHRGAKFGRIGEIDAYLCFAMPAYGMSLEAESLGLGSSILTPNPQKARKLLGLKDKDQVLLMVCIGHPKAGGYRPEHTREQLRHLVKYVG
ncbi:MAG: nitroreductase family protein [Candidatus Marsarchaeota archaeon]|nr:nitroreductase family protein [Candidatus Marsarchaeota archaeon]